MSVRLLIADDHEVIYIDGAAFHIGQRLRRDRFLRDRLRSGNPPWQVAKLRAANLGQGVALVERLRAGQSGSSGTYGSSGNDSSL